MKTREDLLAIVPIMAKKIDSFQPDFEFDEDDEYPGYFSHGYQTEEFYYEEDDWYIVVKVDYEGVMSYDEEDEIVNCEIEVVEINHEDNETCEATEFSYEDMQIFEDELVKSVPWIADIYKKKEKGRIAS